MIFASDKMINEDTKYFTCSCYSAGHTIRVWLDRDEKTANFELYQDKYSFFTRLKLAFCYLFQVGKASDITQEVVLSAAQTKELIKFLESNFKGVIYGAL
jgi:hypothetical protein